MSRSYWFGMVCLAAGLCLQSCGGNSNEKDKAVPKLSKSELKASLTQMEDSLRMMQKNGVKIESLHQIEYINRHLDYYRAYPEDKYSPVCLDKVQWMFLNLQAPQYSIDYSDTILEMYPKYKNRAGVLESQGATYDAIVEPRDSAMVRKYYTMLLDENPSMDKEKREGIRKRLKNNHLSFDEWIMKNN